MSDDRDMRVRIHAEYSLYTDSVAIYVARRNVMDSLKPIQAVSALTWKDIAPGTIRSPLLHMDVTAAQELMDSLWNAGQRPTSLRFGEGVNAHLADMRAIVFAKLNVEKP